MSELFEIELDTHAVEVGGWISGTLVFGPPDPRFERAEHVELRCVAKIHGSGNTERVKAASQRLSGPIAPHSRVPFRAQLPERGPMSWDGRHVTVSWTVEVRIDVAWAIDPRQQAEFRVVPKGAGVWQVPSRTA